MLAGWLADWLAGWLAGWLGWLADWLQLGEPGAKTVWRAGLAGWGWLGIAGWGWLGTPGDTAGTSLPGSPSSSRDGVLQS